MLLAKFFLDEEDVWPNGVALNNDLHGTVTWAVSKIPTSNVPTVPAPETAIAVTVL